MPNHQASEQMLGYLYQVRYALALLLENDNSDFQISIEKFDDVAFSKDGMPNATYPAETSSYSDKAVSQTEAQIYGEH